MKVVFSGGGTGGHIFAAQAVADRLKKERPDSEILFVGAKRGLESRLVPEMGYELKLLPVYPLKGQGIFGVFRSLILIPYSFLLSLLILLKFKPDVVFGVGGYASGPMLLAASFFSVFGKPETGLLEINSVPGVTNRLLSKIVSKIYLSEKSTEKYFPTGKCSVIGSPVRENVLREFESKRKSSNVEDPRTILVIGGSQGAVGMNTMVANTVIGSEKLKGKLKSGELKITHQCGKNDFDRLTKLYSDSGLDHKAGLKLTAFVDDMGKAYAECDLLIARAGAGTLSEIALLGIPSILIPLPTAADNHQEINALGLEKSGGVIVISQAEENESKLREFLENLVFDQSRLNEMSKHLKEHPFVNASESLVNSIISMC